MKKKMIVLICFILGLILVSCENAKMKEIALADGIKLRMYTSSNYYIGFSQTKDELILYPNTWEEMRLPYSIIDDTEAMAYIEGVPSFEKGFGNSFSTFLSEGEECYFYYLAPFVPDEKRQDYHYWIYIKVSIEDENVFKNRMEIDANEGNLLCDKMKLYEKQ